MSLTTDTTPTWTWSSPAGAVSFRHSFDPALAMALWSSTSTPTFTPGSPLGDGTHALHVVAIDALGQVSAVGSKSLTIDTLPPSPPVSALARSESSRSRPQWEWSAGGGGNGTYEIRLDGVAAGTLSSTTWTAPSALSRSPAGVMHTLSIRERDVVGNWSDWADLPLTLKEFHHAVNVAGSERGRFVSSGSGLVTVTRQGGGEDPNDDFPTAFHRNALAALDVYPAHAWVAQGDWIEVAFNAVPGESHTVRGYFGEAFYPANDHRIFHVDVNGTRVLSDFNPNAGLTPPCASTRDFVAVADVNGKVTVRFTAAAGKEASLYGVELLEPSATEPVTRYALDSYADFTSARGSWQGDHFFSGTTSFTDWTSTAVVDRTGLTEAAPERVYQTERWTSETSAGITYTLPAIDSTRAHTLRLHFNEGQPTFTPGDRLFDVYLQGTRVRENLDVVHLAGGSQKALIIPFTGVVPDMQGRIVVNLRPKPGAVETTAMISGLELIVD